MIDKDLRLARLVNSWEPLLNFFMFTYQSIHCNSKSQVFQNVNDTAPASECIAA